MEDTAVSLDEALSTYIDETLSAKNASPLTRRAYERDLAELVDFLTEHGHLTQPQQVSLFHLERFLATLDEKGLSGNYRRRKAAAIRSFFAFCYKRGYVQTNPSLELVPPAREEKEPRFLTEPEYKRLMETVRFQVRDAALIEILLQTGVRLSEIARLRLQDVQLPRRISPDPENAGMITVFGKRRKGRNITLNWKACEALKRYLDKRPDVPYPEIFITKFGKPMGPRSVENVVSKYLEQAGIAGATVHTMRHTFATSHVRNKTSLKVIQAALGHANLATTSRYVGLVAEEMNKQLQEHAL